MKITTKVTTRLFLLLFLHFALISGSFGQSIADIDDLKYYLSRAITMSDIYAQKYSLNNSFHNLTEYNQALDFLVDIEARFIGRPVNLWVQNDYFNGNETLFRNNLSSFVTDVHQKYNNAGLPLPIIQGAVFENITLTINTIEIPQFVAQEFGVSWNPGMKFLYNEIVYSPAHNPINLPNVPDVSRIQTKMWFYYMATLYIDAGFKAIHMGQIKVMDDNDPGHVHYWEVLSKIRQYAADQNTFVLLDGAGMGSYYDPSLVSLANNQLLIYNLFTGNNFTQYQEFVAAYGQDSDINETTNYPANTTLNLLFDFNTSMLKADEVGTAPVGGVYQVTLDPNASYTIYTKSIGGTSPFPNFGYVASNPYLVELDNAGCYNSNVPTGIATPNHWWNTWGWDESTWYYRQPESFKNEFIKTAYNTIQSFDSHGFFQVVGRRETCENDPPAPRGDTFYKAYPNQKDAIKCVWETGEIPSYTLPTSLGTSSICESDLVVFNAQIQGILYYDWEIIPLYGSLASGLTMNTTNSHIAFLQGNQVGTYYVKVTVDHCALGVESYGQTVSVVSSGCGGGGGGIFIKQADESPSLSVYPNPISSDEKFIIELKDNSSDALVQILTMDGKLVQQYSNVVDKIKVNPHNMKPGVYIVSVIKDNRKFHEKIVIKP